jgi:hypothetical protein
MAGSGLAIIHKGDGGSSAIEQTGAPEPINETALSEDSKVLLHTRTSEIPATEETSFPILFPNRPQPMILIARKSTPPPYRKEMKNIKFTSKGNNAATSR